MKLSNIDSNLLGELAKQPISTDKVVKNIPKQRKKFAHSQTLSTHPMEGEQETSRMPSVKETFKISADLVTKVCNERKTYKV